MKPSKFIGTGFTIVTFIFIAFSGIAMFFGFKSGVMKNMHEYLGLAMVVFAIVHIFVNFKPFKMYFKGKIGIFIIILSAILCIYAGASLTGAKGVNPARAMYMQVANKEISSIKNFFKTDEVKFSQFLTAKGILDFDENLSLKTAAKKYNISENELLMAILPNKMKK